MRLGSFNTIPFIDSVIEAERITKKRRRQVVSVLAIAPSGQEACFVMAEGAVKDGRLNLSPPQGDIGRHESLAAAARRCLCEKLQMGVYGKVIYLGSVVRKLDKDHKRAAQFGEYHYHVVALSAGSYRFSPVFPVESAGWHRFCTFDSIASTCMSEEKAAMLRFATRELFARNGDNHIVRRETFPKLGIPLAA